MSLNINTKSMQKEFGRLSLSGDLSSVENFRDWVEESLLIYRDIGSGGVPDEDLVLYLQHIEHLVFNDEIFLNKDRSSWIKSISKRISELKSAIRANKESGKE